MKAVIICGGSGTRLWPLSRKSGPKQFNQIFNNKSLFELTIERNLNLVDGFIVVVNQSQLELCKKQIPHIIKDKVTFVVEPVGRNTAPAIALAALAAPEDELLVLPSDHLIQGQKDYEESVTVAQTLAKQNKLVTFGITAHYPETGYGYIEAQGHEVISFKEKPSLEIAQEYIKSGNYFWNSGMFFFHSKKYLDELTHLAPDLFTATQKAFNHAVKDGDTKRVSLDLMNKIPAISIDYAVMEKSSDVNVASTRFEWNDLGSFDALDEYFEKDGHGNSKHSNYIHYNSKNNFVLSHKRMITTFNVSDLIIIDTDDALLIGKKGQSQNVKKIYELIKESRSELLD